MLTPDMLPRQYSMCCKTCLTPDDWHLHQAPANDRQETCPAAGCIQVASTITMTIASLVVAAMLILVDVCDSLCVAARVQVWMRLLVHVLQDHVPQVGSQR